MPAASAATWTWRWCTSRRGRSRRGSWPVRETQERYGLAVPARLTAAVPAHLQRGLRPADALRRRGRAAHRTGHRGRALPAAPRGADALRHPGGQHHGRHPLRPAVARAGSAAAPPDDARGPERPESGIAAEWIALAGHPNLASREYLYRHYDSEVRGAAVLRPGEADAGVIAPVPGCRTRRGGHGRRQPRARSGRSVRRRRAGGRRGVPQPGLRGGDPGRDHRLPQLRQPRGPGGVLAVPGGGARPGRRLPRPGPDRRAGRAAAGRVGQRQLLQPEPVGTLRGAVADRGGRGDRARHERLPLAAVQARRRPSATWSARRRPICSARSVARRD